MKSDKGTLKAASAPELGGREALSLRSAGGMVCGHQRTVPYRAFPHESCSYPYYCRNHDPLRAGGEHRRCPERNIRADELDTFVFEQVRDALLRPDVLLSGEHAVSARREPAADELLEAQLAKLQRKIDAVAGERRRLADLYQAAFIEREELLRRGNELCNRATPTRPARRGDRPAHGAGASKHPTSTDRPDSRRRFGRRSAVRRHRTHADAGAPLARERARNRYGRAHRRPGLRPPHDRADRQQGNRDVELRALTVPPASAPRKRPLARTTPSSTATQSPGQTARLIKVAPHGSPGIRTSSSTASGPNTCGIRNHIPLLSRGLLLNHADRMKPKRKI